MMLPLIFFSFLLLVQPAGVHTMQWVGTMQRQQLTLVDILPLLLTHPLSTPITTTGGVRLDILALSEEKEEEVVAAATTTAATTEGEVYFSDKALTPLPQPLPCHRLDARVAGCVVVAKTFHAMKDVTNQFAQRIVHKEYTALLVGNVSAAILGLGYSINTPYHNVSIHKASIKTTTTVASTQPELSLDPLALNLLSSDQVSSKQLSPDQLSPDQLPPGDHHLRIDSLVDGLNARTDLQILSVTPCAVYGAITKVLLYPFTGRRHQLRR